VIDEDVEYPSLSPDETRIAFKRRQGSNWRLHVLDLDTKRRPRLPKRVSSTTKSSGSTMSESSTA